MDLDFFTQELARMAGGLDDAVDNYTLLEEAVGSSLPVMVTETVQKKYNVNPYARLTMVDGERTIWMGPKTFELSPVTYDVPQTSMDSMFELVEAYVSDKKIPDISREWTKQHAFRNCTYEHSAYIHHYEMALLRLISTMGDIVIVNPAQGTIWRARELGVKKVCFLTKDKTWLRMMRATMGDDFTEVGSSEKAIYYVGSNGARYTDFAKWVGLGLNPFCRVNVFSETVSTLTNEGIEIRYKRKDRYVDVFYARNSPHYVYNTCTTDKLLQQAARVLLLLSNFSLGIECVDEVDTHNPSYIGALPPYRFVDLQSVSYDARYVYDVKGPGTYFGRGHLLRAMSERLGIPAAPILDEGPFEVDWFYLSPLPSPFRHVTENVTVMASHSARFCSFVHASEVEGEDSETGPVAFMVGNLSGTYIQGMPQGTLFAIRKLSQNQVELPIIPNIPYTHVYVFRTMHEFDEHYTWLVQKLCPLVSTFSIYEGRTTREEKEEKRMVQYDNTSHVVNDPFERVLSLLGERDYADFELCQLVPELTLGRITTFLKHNKNIVVYRDASKQYFGYFKEFPGLEGPSLMHETLWQAVKRKSKVYFVIDMSKVVDVISWLSFCNKQGFYVFPPREVGLSFSYLIVNTNKLVTGTASFAWTAP